MPINEINFSGNISISDNQKHAVQSYLNNDTDIQFYLRSNENVVIKITRAKYNNKTSNSEDPYYRKLKIYDESGNLLKDKILNPLENDSGENSFFIKRNKNHVEHWEAYFHASKADGIITQTHPKNVFAFKKDYDEHTILFNLSRKNYMNLRFLMRDFCDGDVSNNQLVQELTNEIKKFKDIYENNLISPMTIPEIRNLTIAFLNSIGEVGIQFKKDCLDDFKNNFFHQINIDTDFMDKPFFYADRSLCDVNGIQNMLNLVGEEKTKLKHTQQYNLQINVLDNTYDLVAKEKQVHGIVKVKQYYRFFPEKKPNVLSDLYKKINLYNACFGINQSELDDVKPEARMKDYEYMNDAGPDIVNFLEDLNKKNIKLTKEEKHQLADALIEMLFNFHQQDLVHRDIKPDNIGIKWENGIFNTTLIDCLDQKTYGTPQYWPPEFFNKRQYPGSKIFSMDNNTIHQLTPFHANNLPILTKQSDVYSMGLVLYILEINKDYRDGVISQMLQESPSERLQLLDSKKEIKDILESQRIRRENNTNTIDEVSSRLSSLTI